MTMPGGGSDTRSATVDLNANVNPYAQQMQAAAQDTNGLAAAVDRLDSKLEGLTKRAGKKLINLSRDDFAVLTGATATAATFEKQLSSLNATATVTGTSFSGIKAGIEQAFQKFPTARGEIVALAESISDLGVTAPKDIGTLIQTFIKLGAATGEGIQPLAQGLVQLSRLMGNTSAQQIGNYANSLLVVSKNSGVSATGVLSFAQSIAPMARQAGIGEAAVLGISAAFSKAGADGYVAANTFNGIVSDITSLTQSGSPELAKYANLIGVTVSQFKSMDKTTALTDIFSAITKQGPQAINTLNRLGIDGTRAQSAIAAVMQSGGLQSAIAQATGSSNDQSALNKGSSAAFNNLADGLAKIRNEFTEFGTMIGTTFIGPLGKMVQMLNTALSAVNNFVRPFAPIIAVLAATAGALSAVGGAALSVAGIIGTIGLAKLAVNSGPVRALREGVGAGSGGAVNRSGQMYEQDQIRRDYGMGYGSKMPLRARVPYVFGSGIGAVMPEPVSLAEGTNGAGGPSVGAQVRRGIMTGPIKGVTAFVRSNTKLSADQALNDYERSAYQTNPEAGRGFKASATNALQQNKLNTEEMTTTQAVIASLRDFAAALIQAGAQVTKTGMSVVRPSNWKSTAGNTAEEDAALAGKTGAMSRMAGVARSAGNVAGAAGGLAKTVGGGLMGLAGGPVGLGIMGTIGAVEAYSALQNATKKSDAVTGNSINPLQKLNDQLGITTTTMATFNNAVGSAAKTLGDKIPQNTTLSQAVSVSGSDISSFATQKSTDKTISAFAKYDKKKNNVGGLTALAQSYNMTDPRSVAAFKDNAIASGYSADVINQALRPLAGQNGQVVQGTPNYAALAQQVGKTEGHGMFSEGNSSQTGDMISASALTSIDVQRQTDQNTHSLGYSNVKSYQNASTYLTALAAEAKKSPDASNAFASALATLTGGKKGDFTGNFVNGSYTGGTSQADIQKLLQGSKAGKNYLASVGQGAGPELYNALTKGTATPQQVQAYLTANSGQTGTTGAYATLGNVQQGNIGKFALNNSDVQKAIASPDDANQQTKAMLALYGQVTKTTGSFGDATKALDAMKANIQDTSDPLYKLADAAKAYAQQQEQFVTPTLSREGQFQQAATDYTTAQQSAAENPTDPSAQANVQAAQQSYQTSKENYRQYLISLYQAAQSYGTQMERAQEDQNTTLARNKLQFYIQQTQAQEDFQRQNMLSVRDFNIQMVRQAQSAAESIYNPYQRVNAETTVSASTLVQNLQDQNAKIEKQYQQLQQLQQMGVSQSAIDTLKLSDPSNAQQLNNIIQGVTSDPNLVAQINAAVGTRIAATTQLTQSNFSETFRNTTSDFQRQLSDTADAYNIQRQRSVDAQALSLSQMAQDYNKMVTRSAQDLNTSMTQIYGSYATVYGNTLGEINSQIGQYAPAIAANLVTEIQTMQATIDAALSPPPPTPLSEAQLRANAAGYTSNGSYNNQPSTYQHASGGISTFAHQAAISEGNKPEAIIPLDSRGVAFMANFSQQISMALLRQMNVAQYPSQGRAAGGGSQSYMTDNSTTITGPVTVTGVNDVKTMKSELDKAKRLKALSQPPSSTAG